MPIYEFKCQKCGFRFEALISLGGENQVSCEKCSSTDIGKLVSSFGIGGGSARIKSSSSCSTCSATSCDTCQ